MGELDSWFEDHEDLNVFYGPREDSESAEQAFEELMATFGDGDMKFNRAEKIWLRRVEGEEALEFFDGEYEAGWVVGTKDNGVPAWEIEVYL